jgi:outer membrane protein assembly factor BamB
MWSVNLGGRASYPLIVGGRVFVTVAKTGLYGTKLYALDESTRQSVWGPIDLGGTYYWSHAAYDNGSVFVVNYDGLLRAFEAGTGTLVWSTQLPGQYAFSSPPTAFNGIVCTGGAGSGGTINAVEETNGRVLWTKSVANGDHSSPAVSSSGVYVSYACAYTYDFNPLSGILLWHYAGSCSGGGRTPVVSGGFVYVRDWATSPSGYLFEANTGTLIRRFQAGPIPAFKGNRGLFLNAGRLEAQDAATGQVLWSFAGDGSLSSAPLIVNQTVYIGSTSGNLYGLDIQTGKQAWSVNVGASILAPDEQNVSQPLTGLGAGDRMIVVPASNLLVAFH